MLQKIKDWTLTILVIVAGVFGLSLLTRDDKKKLEKAKENIKKAGGEIEEKHFDDVDCAAKYIDDVLSRVSGKPVREHRKD